MTDTTARAIADSVSPEGKRLLSLELRYPKFIHGELMTHRVFSRNASSSRAVPITKLIQEATSDELRAEPSFSVVNAPGMQGGRPTTEHEQRALQQQWRVAAGFSAATAELMFKLGGAKQDVNRLLEPFTHINVLATSTEWENFFGLRLDKDAQPEMRWLAQAMWVAYCESEPVLLHPGEWHLPYVDAETMTDVGCRHANQMLATDEMLKISAARCARVSYRSHDTGKQPTLEEDLKLFERLMLRGAKHASPAEHQATPDLCRRPTSSELMKDPFKTMYGLNEHEWGNFVGWRQHRKMIPGEAAAPLPEGYAWPK